MDEYSGATKIDPISLLMAGGFNNGAFNNRNRNDFGGGVLTAEALANGTATKEAIDCNATRTSDQTQRLSDQAEEGRRSAQVTSIVDQANTNTNRISDRMATTTLQDAISDGNVRVENVRQNSEIQKWIADCCCSTNLAIATAAKEAAACCCAATLEALRNACETQKLIAAEGAATRSLILEVEARSNVAALAVAQAKINQLETINALSHRHHG